MRKTKRLPSEKPTRLWERILEEEKVEEPRDVSTS
jgi:hypothetical protein